MACRAAEEKRGDAKHLRQPARHGCTFDSFFANPEGATPQKLLKQNIYSQIATPLKYPCVDRTHDAYTT